jgi:hypothetical protein
MTQLTNSSVSVSMSRPAKGRSKLTRTGSSGATDSLTIIAVAAAAPVPDFSRETNALCLLELMGLMHEMLPDVEWIRHRSQEEKPDG